MRFALMLVCFSAAACGGADPLPKRPNILWIYSDDHAYQAISAYGSVLNKTPNIDRIAEQGMRFDRSIVENSICAPAKAAVLTGAYSHVHGVKTNAETFDGSQVTLPKLLREAGYQTAIVGKWHLKSEPTGFDHWEVLPGQGHYDNPDFRIPGGTHRREGYATEVLTDMALSWLEEDRDPERPFLLMLQHKAPHRNWIPGMDELEAFDGVVFPEPPTLFDDYAGRASGAELQEMEIGRHMTMLGDLGLEPLDASEVEAWDRNRSSQTHGRMAPEHRKAWRDSLADGNVDYLVDSPEGDDLVRWKYQRYMRLYLSCIAGIDKSVGRVLDWLEESGLAENTVVCYASDQGFFLGEHGWFDKRWMYEESLRTPLLVRWPGVTNPGSATDRLVSNIDMAPTFLEMAGAVAPASMQGASVVPLLAGRTPADWRTSAYYHYYESLATHNVPEHYGVVTDTHKLIRYPLTDEWELFDRATDPQEVQSVHDDPAYAQVRAELEAELVRLRRELGVPD